jgi:hypothetical protein
MKNMFAKHPHYLKFLPSFLKSNKQFLRPILAENGAVLEFASDKLRADSGYIISFLSHDLEEHQLEKKEFASKKDIIIDSQAPQKTKKINVIKTFEEKRNYHKLFLYSSDSVKNNLNSVIKIMSYAQNKSDYRFYKYLPDKYKESALFWVEFVKATNSLQLVSYSLKNNIYLNAMIQKDITTLSVSEVIGQLSEFAEKEVLEKKTFV